MENNKTPQNDFDKNISKWLDDTKQQIKSLEKIVKSLSENSEENLTEEELKKDSESKIK